MSLGLQALLAVMPILIAAVLLVGFRWPAKWAMPIVYVTAAAIALWAWGVSFSHVVASTIQGLFVTVDILLIIFGAILLLNTLKHSGAVTAIRSGFAHEGYFLPIWFITITITVAFRLINSNLGNGLGVFVDFECKTLSVVTAKNLPNGLFELEFITKGLFDLLL